MGHKGVRAMTPLPADTANELRVKLGRGRDLPVETKPRRAVKAKEAVAVGESGADADAAPAKKRAEPKRAIRPAAAKAGKVDLEPEPTVEAMKPAATIFRPS